MPQKPFIFRLHFYTADGTATHSLGSGAHHVAYMGSADKQELLVEDGPDRSSLESAAIHAQYAGERAGSLGYFGNLADRPQAAQQSILQAQGPVWRIIASVGEEDAIAMGGGLLTKAGWEEGSEPVVAQMIQELRLDPQKVQWIAAVHRHQHHENNPHVHLLLWEAGTPSRKTGEWTKQELQAIKREAVSHLYQPERTQLGQAKTAMRNKIRDTVKTLITPANGQQGFRQELAERLQTLGQRLPKKGRLAYAYMPEGVKAHVTDILRWLWTQDPALKMLHDRYLDAAEKMPTFYWHVDEDQSQNSPVRATAIQKARAHAETDLIQRMAAAVLKAAHTEAWHTQWQREHEAVSAGLSDDAIRQVMHGQLAIPELMDTPALRQWRQEMAFRVYAPFPEASNAHAQGRSQLAGTIYRPPEPASTRFTWPFFLTERSEKPEKPLSLASRLPATTGTLTAEPRSFPCDPAGLNTKFPSKAPDTALQATLWTPLRPRTWTFMGPQGTAEALRAPQGAHILATPFDLAASQKRQDQATDRFKQRLAKHVRNLAGERGLMPSGHSRRGLTPTLPAAIQQVMHQAERNAARTAYWLAQSQYQRQRAERAMARNTGQEIAL